MSTREGAQLVEADETLVGIALCGAVRHDQVVGSDARENHAGDQRVLCRVVVANGIVAAAVILEEANVRRWRNVGSERTELGVQPRAGILLAGERGAKGYGRGGKRPRQDDRAAGCGPLRRYGQQSLLRMVS
jgi:hypothetical protein